MNALALAVLALSVALLAVWAGGIVPQSVCIVAVAACSTCALIGLRRQRGTGTATPPSLEWVAVAALAVLAFTAIPWPAALDCLMDAGRQQQHHAVRQALQDIAGAGVAPCPPSPMALTRNWAGTARALLLLSAVIGTGFLAAQLTRAARIAWLVLLVLIGTLVAVAGNVGQWWIPQGDTLWWFYPIPHVLPGPVGCFINRNHFGGFVAMLVPVALGMAAWAAMSRRWFTAVAMASAALAMGTAALMSLSRGAWLALAIGLAGTVLVAAWRRHARLGWILVAAAGLLVAALASLPSSALRERLQTLRTPSQDLSVHSRLTEWRETLRVWPHYPIAGAGANALRMVYPQTRQSSGSRWLVHAENMPLEMLAEGGLIGLSLLVLALVFLVRRTQHALPLLPDACRLGIAGGLLVASAHALWDFAALVPVYAVVTASLIGVLLPVPEPGSGPQRLIRLAPLLAGLLVSAALVPTLGDLRKLEAPETLRSATIPELQRALVWAPTSWHAWYYLGVAIAQYGVDHRLPRACRLGERIASHAAECDPNNYRLWYRLGEMRLALKDGEGARAAFDRARALRPWLAPPPLDIPGGAP